jgi:hypothetical protein
MTDVDIEICVVVFMCIVLLFSMGDVASQKGRDNGN